ncbi:hypothetical protein DJ533_00065 (plasmid) [Acinetobacter defluvii]|uniref:Uncharacterized protein n=1 Tax=Acinetobacter defluvii TaxID=1871111 RepID=A0A2S2F815_9GAMM|nr:hypothetical protein [Acinetobacter defluvii]AWL27114.1 hypothetical protein DJ533_00065 [Acinetobacter defluvii]
MKLKRLGLLYALTMIAMPSFAANVVTETQAVAILKGDGVKSVAAQSLFRNGVFSNKGFDNNAEAYRGYYFSQKPLTFLNFNVAALDIPYKTMYVGCCVIHQNSFILSHTIKSDMDTLHRFARKNNCRVDSDGLDGIIDPIAVKFVKKSNTTHFVSITCENPNAE